MSPVPVRVLVVEDEAIQRQALVAMCRAILPPAQAEVKEAPDGKTAVAEGLAWNAEIVLMDIRMPAMDGLEAARRLAEGGSRPKRTRPEIIFITAHDDFAYAREALSVGAAEYLLKPVALEELRKVLVAALGKVTAARRTAEQARRLKAALPLLRLQAFRDLFDGIVPCPDDSPTVREGLSLAGVAGQPSLAMFFELEPPAGSAAQAAAAEQDVAAAFARTLRRRAGARWLAGPTGPGRLGLFLAPPASVAATAVRDWSLAVAAELKREAERITGHLVSAGVGESHAERGGLLRSVREALDALRHGALLGSGGLVHVTDVRGEAGPRNPETGMALPPASSFLDAIRLGQADKAAAQAARARQDLALAASGRKGTAPDGLEQVLTAELIALCGRAALEGGADAGSVRRLQARALRWTPLGEQEFTAFAGDLAALTREAQAARQGGLVKQALAYIRANFRRPITLEEVAREVHVSHYYLSHLLSRESGKSFTDHVTALRVGKARELLASSDLGVSEIAAEVGFADGNYFSRVFKRVTGSTPSAFRRQNRQQVPAPEQGNLEAKRREV